MQGLPDVNWLSAVGMIAVVGMVVIGLAEWLILRGGEAEQAPNDEDDNP